MNKLHSTIDTLNEVLPEENSQDSLINMLRSGIESLDKSGKSRKKIKVRLNIFVHGTLASVSNGFSPKKVLQNIDMSGSWAENLVRNLCRKDLKIHFNNSLMYHEGLFRVQPGQEGDEKTEKEFGLFPILDAFKIAQKCTNEDTVELYYLFGWSGMLSQYERIKSALCFFNALRQEQESVNQALESFKSTQLETEVLTEIYAHSHGSNVSLLLGLVDSWVSGYDLWDVYACFDHHIIYEKQKKTLESILEKYCSGQDKKETKENSEFAMDKWLFKPKKSTLEKPLVSRLFMLAGPIQPENFPLGFCKTFSRVENWFSPTDNIQRLDQFSVPSRTCSRFVHPDLICSATESCKKMEKLQQDSQHRFFQREVLYKSSPIKEGPSHLEFWMVSFKKKDKPSIRPIPLLCLIPLLANSKSVVDKQDTSLFLNLNHIDCVGIECQTLYQNSFDGAAFVIPTELLQSLKKVIEEEKELLVSPTGDKNGSKLRNWLLNARIKLVETIATS